MLIREHALEEYWLNKRIELLHRLDDLAEETYNDNDLAMTEDDPRIDILKKQYADVIDPVDVEKVLKSIYPRHLYAPKVSK